MEAIDVEENRLLWRDSVSAASNDLIGLREQIQTRLRQGLIPRLGADPGGPRQSTSPRNPEAYDLYLRSSAVSHDPEPNRQAIGMLERSVRLDPTFAPAWHFLGLRYYYESEYGGGGTASYEQSRSAFQRSIALDPNQTDTIANLAIMRTEGGDLEGAYDDASRLVRRRPDSPEAHHTLGYVLRYAGLLEDAGRQCDTAISLDPKNYQWRSCALTFELLGRYDRAKQFVALDAGSLWAANMTIGCLLRQGQSDEARRIGERMDVSSSPLRHQWMLLALILRRAPAEEIAAATSKIERDASAIRDSEPHYWIGSIFSYCGQREAALRQLRTAVEGGWVAHQAMDADPMYAGVRSDPEFAAIRALAIERQKKFLAHRARKD
jgi:Flp pilus assembly protein TadD